MVSSSRMILVGGYCARRSEGLGFLENLCDMRVSACARREILHDTLKNLVLQHHSLDGRLGAGRITINFDVTHHDPDVEHHAHSQRDASVLDRFLKCLFGHLFSLPDQRSSRPNNSVTLNGFSMKPAAPSRIISSRVTPRERYSPDISKT